MIFDHVFMSTLLVNNWLAKIGITIKQYIKLLILAYPWSLEYQIFLVYKKSHQHNQFQTLQISLTMYVTWLLSHYKSNPQALRFLQCCPFLRTKYWLHATQHGPVNINKFLMMKLSSFRFLINCRLHTATMQ